MDNMVWKNWAPPKCKLFSWLIIQNRVWTADRLERRGWPNGRLCPLCRREDETARHLLFTCRFSIRLWGMIKNWLNVGDFNPPNWVAFNDVQSWWEHLAIANGRRRKAIPSLLMLVTWEIWNERNSRIFKHLSTLPTLIFARIKLEARNWVLAGAKHLGHLLPGD